MRCFWNCKGGYLLTLMEFWLEGPTKQELVMDNPLYDCQGQSLGLLILLWRIGDIGRAKGEKWKEGCWRRIVGRELGF